ncbi:fibrous sheath CABYR-binding protein-like isoform X1 [Pollicipes pollicipes]|uniref:fibrous sheath CABYR-binding protein-like isoform X1 n=1 Tax=Pollicipes pollicipes TaxID=41117 RepID=UPI0018859449|nr:fibrous sheath CABYR-binding protein-like isoform X1 [Pollicipes pollicipes]
MAPVKVMLVLVLAATAFALPMDRQVRETAETEDNSEASSGEVCVVDGVVYERGAPVPTASGCELCVCQPPGFACSAIQCEQRANTTGCQRSGSSATCCPQYQCPCQFGGETFEDGSRIEDPAEPCIIRYCIDGLVRTTTLRCFTRDDCAPRTVAGRCCPSYDHCPALGKFPQGPAEPYPAESTVSASEQTAAPEVDTVTATEAGEETAAEEASEEQQNTDEASAPEAEKATDEDEPTEDKNIDEQNENKEEKEEEEEEEEESDKAEKPASVPAEESAAENLIPDTDESENGPTTDEHLELAEPAESSGLEAEPEAAEAGQEPSLGLEADNTFAAALQLTPADLTEGSGRPDEDGADGSGIVNFDFPASEPLLLSTEGSGQLEANEAEGSASEALTLGELAADETEGSASEVLGEATDAFEGSASEPLLLEEIAADEDEGSASEVLGEATDAFEGSASEPLTLGELAADETEGSASEVLGEATDAFEGSASESLLLGELTADETEGSASDVLGEATDAFEGSASEPLLLGELTADETEGSATEVLGEATDSFEGSASEALTLGELAADETEGSATEILEGATDAFEGSANEPLLLGEPAADETEGSASEVLEEATDAFEGSASEALTLGEPAADEASLYEVEGSGAAASLPLQLKPAEEASTAPQPAESDTLKSEQLLSGLTSRGEAEPEGSGSSPDVSGSGDSAPPSFDALAL